MRSYGYRHLYRTVVFMDTSDAYRHVRIDAVDTVDHTSELQVPENILTRYLFTFFHNRLAELIASMTASTSSSSWTAQFTATDQWMIEEQPTVTLVSCGSSSSSPSEDTRFANYKATAASS